MSRGRRDTLRSLTSLLVFGSMTMRLLVFSLLTNTSPVSLANPAAGMPATGRPTTSAAIQSGADNGLRAGTGDPLLLAKTIAPSVRLIQAAGQAACPLAWRCLQCNLAANREAVGDGRSLRRRNYGARPVIGQRGKDLWPDQGRQRRQLFGPARRIHRAARPQRGGQIDAVPAALRPVRP